VVDVDAHFVEDPDFVDNLLHWRGSLNPVGDSVRRATDKVLTMARRTARAEIAEATSAVNAAHSRRFSKSGKARYAQAKAMLYSLKRYSELLYAIEVAQPDENIGAVCAGHAAGAQIEFGGTDSVIRAGDAPLVYSARHILRRSV
jgi:hypothetical protein